MVGGSSPALGFDGGDSIEQGAVQRRQLFGGGRWLHRASTMGRLAREWYGPSVPLGALTFGAGRSIPAVTAAPDPEASERARRGHPGLADAVDGCCRRPLPNSLEESGQSNARSLGDAMNRAIRVIGDPTLEFERRRFAQDEIAETDAVDEADHLRVEPLGRGCRGHGRAASGNGGATRPGQCQGVEDQLRRNIRGKQLGRPCGTFEESGRGAAWERG